VRGHFGVACDPSKLVVADNHLQGDSVFAAGENRIAMAATRIDCDIHPSVVGMRTTLLPYLDEHRKAQAVSRTIDASALNIYPPTMPLSGYRSRGRKLQLEARAALGRQ
jgi:hypothetical protein